MAIILRLDRVMADRKMSLNRLAELVGISNVNLSNIKTGKISAVRFSTLNGICKALDCQPGDILEYVEDEEEENDQQKKRAAFRFGMTGNTEVCGHSFLNCETKEECRMRYIGLDVHKDNITACVLTGTGKPKFEKDFLKESGNWILDELLDFGDKEGFCVMMESGTYAYAPFRFFSDRGIEVHVVHAKALKVITDSDKKTDRKDALTIAKMLRLWKKGDIDLQMAYMPTREQCELKDICRYREEISKKIGDETRRIKSHMSRNCEYLPEEFDNFQTEKAREFVKKTYPEDRTLMRRMDCPIDLFGERDLIKEDVESRLPGSRDVELLCGIPGIGRQTAVQIMSMIVDVNRFADAEKLCAYFGMVPRVRDSGGKEHHGRMTKNGDRMMRMIMERVTESHVRNCNSSLTQYYKRKREEMGTKKALITASRKMLSVIYAVLKSGRDFRIAA